MPSVYLLGSTHYKTDGGTILSPDLRRKTRALLAYVCLSDEPLNREHLANLFCSNAKDPQGSLRWHISRIRRNFCEDALHIESDAIRVNRSVLWVDAHAFIQHLERSGKPLSVHTAETALKLYRGEVLAGHNLPGETDFDLWLLGQRARYTQIFEKHALSLIRRLVEMRAHDQALSWAKTLLYHNSTLEDVHYWLIWLYARTGQKGAALQQFAAYKEHILAEFDARPSDRLVNLYAQIQRNKLPDLESSESAFERMAHPSTKAALQTGVSPFVGRVAELDQLRDHWQGVRDGVGRAVVIQAEGGMGKSALVSHFTAELPQRVPVYTGMSYASTTTSALAPWIKIIRDCLQPSGAAGDVMIPEIIRTRLSLLVPDLILLDDPAPDALQKGDWNVSLLLNTIVDFFSLLSARQPFVIVLEDFHFADESSVQLLSLLLDRLKRIAVLVLITQRPVEAHDNPSLRRALDEWQATQKLHAIMLGRLSDTAILDLIAIMLPNAERKEALRSKLIDHTLGISLHLMDVLHSCQSEPNLLDEQLPIPMRFATLVQQRLGSMTESQRQLLETLAIVEYPITLNEILECTGQNETETIQNLDYIMRHRFIQAVTEDGKTTYGFLHFLYRDVVAGTLSNPRKYLLHRRATRLFERQAAILPGSQRIEVVNRVVYHAQQADDIDALIRWVPIAADQSIKAFAYRQALDLYHMLDAALKQTPRLTRENYIRMLLKMVELLRYLGDWKAQAEVLERVAAWDADTPIADLNLRLSFVLEQGANLMRSGQYDAARHHFNEALMQATENTDRMLIAQTHNNLGTLAYFCSDWDEAERHYLQAIALREGLGDDIGLGKGYNNLGAVAYHRGKYEQAIDFYRQNLMIREEHNDQHGIATSLNNIGTIYMTLGQWDDASTHYQRALKIRRNLDDQHGIASTLNNLAIIASLMDRQVEAIGYHQESLSIREAINDRSGVARSLAALGECHISLADYDTAIGYLQRSVTLRRELGDKMGLAESMLDLSYARAIKTCSLPDHLFYDALQIAYDHESNTMMCTALEKYAAILVCLGETKRCARYLGLADAQKLDQRRSLIDWTRDALRAHLDEDILYTEMRRGAKMDLKQVIRDLLENRP